MLFKTGWLVPPVLMTLKSIIDRLPRTLCWPPLIFVNHKYLSCYFLSLFILALILYEIIRAIGMDLLKLARNTGTKAGWLALEAWNVGSRCLVFFLGVDSVTHHTVLPTTQCYPSHQAPPSCSQMLRCQQTDSPFETGHGWEFLIGCPSGVCFRIIRGWV